MTLGVLWLIAAFGPWDRLRFIAPPWLRGQGVVRVLVVVAIAAFEVLGVLLLVDVLPYKGEGQ